MCVWVYLFINYLLILDTYGTYDISYFPLLLFAFVFII